VACPVRLSFGMAVERRGNLFVADMENYTNPPDSPSGWSARGWIGWSQWGRTARAAPPASTHPRALPWTCLATSTWPDTDTTRFARWSRRPARDHTGPAWRDCRSSDGLGSAVRSSARPASLRTTAAISICRPRNDTAGWTVGYSTAIQTQPQSQTVRAGSSVQFSVTPRGVRPDLFSELQRHCDQ